MGEIKAQYTHSKFGTFMFNLCARWTKFIVKHKFLYYFLSIFWNTLMTFAAFLITIPLGVASLFTKKITFHKYLWIYYIKAGPAYWGGFDTSIMFIRDQSSYDKQLNAHEFGHAIAQGTLLGPLFPFIVAIPSAVRWWIQYFNEKKGKENQPYNSVWFEDSASQCGKYAAEYLSR